MAMQIIDNITIDPAVFDKLKRLHYKDSFNKEVLREQFVPEIYEKSIDLNIEYNDFKAKVTAEFIPEQYRSEKYNWSADFYNNCLVIYINTP